MTTTTMTGSAELVPVADTVLFATSERLAVVGFLAGYQGLTRNAEGALLVAAGLAGAVEHALISLLGLNGLRVSESLGVNIDDLGLERGHRTITVGRKGGKIVTMPLAPRVARALDLAIGDRARGPVFVTAAGQRMDRHAAGRMVRRIARSRRDRQAGHATHVVARVHHCRPRRRRAAARCPGSR